MNLKSFLTAGCIVALGLGISGCSKDNDEEKVTLQRINVTPESLRLAVDETQRLTATPEPGNASDVSFVWSSSNETIAAVSQTGEVTAHAAGDAVISVASGSIKKDVPVTVTAAVPLTGFSVTPATVTIVLGEADETAQLTPVPVPTDATGVVISYTSDNEDVATVDESSGLISAVATGSATITVTATAGSVTKTAIVPVTVSPPDFEKSTWEVVTSSTGWYENDDNPSWAPGKAIDGDKNTAWHSRAGVGVAPGHTLVFDMKKIRTVRGIKIWNRQDEGGLWSGPNEVKFEVSDSYPGDDPDWKLITYITGMSKDTANEIDLEGSRQTGRYLKMVIIHAWGTDTASYIAEITPY